MELAARLERGEEPRGVRGVTYERDGEIIANEPRPPIEEGLPPLTPLVVTRSGDLALGELNQSDGLFELTLSEYEEQETGFAALGFDLDTGGNNTVFNNQIYDLYSGFGLRLRGASGAMVSNRVRLCTPKRKRSARSAAGRL